jgi:hypothetical protein
MFGSTERRRTIEAAKLVLKYAVEFGKPRFALSAANAAGVELTLPQKSQLSLAINSRQDLSARVDDYIDFISLIAVSTIAYKLQVDAMVEEIAGWHDGAHIPRVAKYAQDSALRARLIEKMFAQGPKADIMPFFEALGPQGLSPEVLSQFGEKLMKLAILQDEEYSLTAAAYRFAKRPVAETEWRTLIEKRMQKFCDPKSFANVLHAAALAVG